MFVIHQHFSSYIKQTQQLHNPINNTILSSCKTLLLTGQQFINLLPAIELLTDGLIFIGSISHMIY